MTAQERIAAHAGIHRQLGWDRWRALQAEIGRELVGESYVDGLAYSIEQYGWDRAAEIVERVAAREGVAL